MDHLAKQIEAIVLVVHRRNGGNLTCLDFNLRFLDQSLGLDSLDLAEIMVEVERQFHFCPFDSPTPPRTWTDLLAALRLTHEETI